MPDKKPEVLTQPRDSVFEEEGGVYLLVADDTPEFEAALKRVQYLAKKNKGHIALLHVIEEEGYLHWKYIERQIKTDKREQTESFLWNIAQRINQSCGEYPAFYIKEGVTRKEVAEIIAEDKTIRALVLGASANNSNPLITYFTGKGLYELKVPLVVVPEGY